MDLTVVTIGVYGFSESAFFDALREARVEAFCDIRARRGVRGSAYAFANSARLQQRLQVLGIPYIHLPSLAPSSATRALQSKEDAIRGDRKRTRAGLAAAYVRAYEDECLSCFDSAQFVRNLGPGVRAVALFCVEGEPAACHRSLVAQRLARDLGVPVRHLRPRPCAS
jgi:uncharacterized protein (DUF488 family)